MANLEREISPRQLSPEEMALNEVEGYLERVEKKPEIDASIANTLSPSQAFEPPVVEDQGEVIMQSVTSDPIIELPLTQQEIAEGLRHPIVDSLLWLANQCVMIIKKYPGRVFYKQQ